MDRQNDYLTDVDYSPYSESNKYDVTNNELWRIVESINPKHDNFHRIAVEDLNMDKVRQEFIPFHKRCHDHQGFLPICSS